MTSKVGDIGTATASAAIAPYGAVHIGGGCCEFRLLPLWLTGAERDAAGGVSRPSLPLPGDGGSSAGRDGGSPPSPSSPPPTVPSMAGEGRVAMASWVDMRDGCCSGCAADDSVGVTHGRRTARIRVERSGVE